MVSGFSLAIKLINLLGEIARHNSASLYDVRIVKLLEIRISRVIGRNYEKGGC